MVSRMSAGVLLAGVVLVFAIGGCGGGGNSGPLTLQAYLSQVNAAKQQAGSDLAKLGDPFLVRESGDPASKAAGDNLRQKAQVLGQFQQSLRALQPPAEARVSHQEMLAALSALGKLSSSAGERATAAVSVTDMLSLRRDLRTGAESAQALSGFEEGCWGLQTLAGQRHMQVDLKCGEGAFARQPLKAPEYFKQLQASFEQARAKTDEIARQLAGALDRATTLGEKKAAVQRFLDATRGEFESVTAQIEALSPPADAREAHWQLLDAARELTALAGDYGKQVSGALAGSDASERVAEFDTASQQPVQQSDRACASLQSLADGANSGLHLGCQG